MLPLARLILIAVTVVATLVASSLQGRVLCYSQCGEHLAIEVPHADAGCPTSHDDHRHHGDEGEGTAEHPETPGDCTDVSSDVDFIRDASDASAHALHLSFAAVPAFSSVVMPAAGPLCIPAAHDVGPPPEAGDLARLRTIILLS